MQKKIYSVLALLLVMQFYAISQIAPNHYLVNFTDKNYSSYTTGKPEMFLSKRAIERRQRFSIKITSEDLPVSKYYIDSLKSMGLKIINVSKWTNSACVYTKDSLLINTIKKLSFVSHIGIRNTKQKPLTNSPKIENKDSLKPDSILPFEEFKKSKEYAHYDSIYGNSLRQIQIHNGHLLHKAGYRGEGVHVAILDGGFYKVNELPAFDSVRANNQILGVKDFVDSDSMVYDASSHGMKAFSTMAGYIPNKLVGTAPKAKYWLLRTEQGSSEYIIEEYNWLAAAEFADSVGVDLINSSLGYNTFYDSLTNHTYKDMDGDKSLASQAADIAASKGILVVVSAGNTGRSKWKYITVPADADSALTVGAISKKGKKASFSAFGPTADNRIKPDVCAVGISSIVSGRDGKISKVNGTSFSSPIMAGIVTCLIQAHPNLSNMELIEILRKSSSQYKNPDNKLGYGIPDAYKAHLLAKKKTKH